MSHHLDEVYAICDRVTVFRSGKTVITPAIAQTTPSQVVRHMAGHDLQATLPTAATPRCGRVAALRRHTGDGRAGRYRMGHCQAGQAFAGGFRGWPSTILRDGTEPAPRAPADIIAAAIGFVTEDRKDDGLILALPISANVSGECIVCRNRPIVTAGVDP